MQRLLRVTVTVLVVGIVAYFFGSSLADNWDQVREQQIGFGWNLVLACLLFTIAVPVSGVLWGAMVNRLNKSKAAPAREAIKVHCASWLLKYVPGQMGSFVNKVLWGARKGVSKTLVSITFVYENVFLVLAATIPSAVILVLALGGDRFTGDSAALLPVAAVVPLILVSNRWVFARILAPLLKRFAKKDVPPEYFLTNSAMLKFQLLYVVPRLLNGIGFVLVAASVTDVTAGEWLPLAAAYMLAGAAGLLAIFVPSGIGVREAVVVLFASAYMTVPEAIIAALLARLLSTLGDAFVALIYGYLRLMDQRKAEVASVK